MSFADKLHWLKRYLERAAPALAEILSEDSFDGGHLAIRGLGDEYPDVWDVGIPITSRTAVHAAGLIKEAMALRAGKPSRYIETVDFGFGVGYVINLKNNFLTFVGFPEYPHRIKDVAFLLFGLLVNRMVTAEEVEAMLEDVARPQSSAIGEQLNMLTTALYGLGSRAQPFVHVSTH